MIDISTSFVGLELQSPLIVGSSGLTRNLDKVKYFAKVGAGAVVCKSLFEEQIEAQGLEMLRQSDYPEAADYIATYVRSEELSRYLEHIEKARKELTIPVIASINCRLSSSWIEFASQIEQAGAHALEVNIMRLETDLFFDPKKNEDFYVQVVSELSKRLSIPIIVKLSRHHTAIPALVDKLRAAGASAVTLFNRAYQPDIDLDKEELISGDIFTHAGDFTDTMRFTGLVSGLIPQIEISASTGVYTWQELVKALLVGAQTAQMCTALYKQGAPAISDALMGMRMWMQKQGYERIDEFRARLNSTSIPEAGLFERMQFMKYFSRHVE
ncbi:dihydroorotate dehydrogenase-like protein [Porphyromonas sp. COT-239 OH1446]|uniref:dihydroorotate dehydrogenase-like protein n=1 Tax=Porphyromonas sp. COT-239 OH1446 TaxID=1515613 RepID=UPI00052D24F1|nr:dihydroorotate dehydrogenase-like protein [Porphyromonas sp. COT-239 OH1446]KGN67158.1 diguanylate cyclase [Porphyromonas sp. COT-239 OH1446]